MTDSEGSTEGEAKRNGEHLEATQIESIYKRTYKQTCSKTCAAYHPCHKLYSLMLTFDL